MGGNVGHLVSWSRMDPAYAQYTDGVVKIGILTDLSSLYADNGGPGSVAAAKLAVADFGAEAKGIKAEIVSADQQTKPDLASSIASAWFDEDKVDVNGSLWPVQAAAYAMDGGRRIGLIAPRHPSALSRSRPHEDADEREFGHASLAPTGSSCPFPLARTCR
jgi:hypothetical protein